MKQPKISIIIPVYNGEKYLKRCLDSILNQTLKALQIIVVDDGSSDKSLDLVKTYQKKDTRIEVISQMNQGVSKARNTGIAHAIAPYVMFIDVDDWIDEQNCEVAYNTIEKEQVDIVFWTYMREYKNTSLIKVLFKQNKRFDETTAPLLRRRFVGLINEELGEPEQSDAITPVWGKLYKKSIIVEHQIYFEDLKKIGTCEDGLFNLYYFQYVQKAYYIHQPFYHYYKDNESAFTKTYKGDLFKKYQVMLQMIQDYIEENEQEPSYKEALNNRRCMSLIGIGLTECIQSNPKNHLEKIKFIKEIINDTSYKNAYKQLKLNYFPLKWRIFFGSAKYNFATGIYILLLMINKIITR